MLRRAAGSLLSKSRPKFPKPIISQSFKTLIIPPTPSKKSFLSIPILTTTTTTTVITSRSFSTSIPAADVSKERAEEAQRSMRLKMEQFEELNDSEINKIEVKFGKTLQHIHTVLRMKGNVHWIVEWAHQEVEVVMDMYDGLLERLDDDDEKKERAEEFHRSMVLKMEQLKADLSKLDDDSVVNVRDAGVPTVVGVIAEAIGKP